MKKHIPPLLLALWPYLILGFPLLNDFPNLLDIYGMAYFAGSCIVYLGNMIYAFRSSELAPWELARWDFVIKLVQIPAYLALFALGLMLLLAIVVPAVFMAALMGIPALAFVDLVLLLSSSCYGFSALRRAKNAGTVTRRYALLHTVLHCLFIGDVISAFQIRRKLKNT